MSQNQPYTHLSPEDWAAIMLALLPPNRTIAPAASGHRPPHTCSFCSEFFYPPASGKMMSLIAKIARMIGGMLSEYARSKK
ncbi:MAG: hypothetical protein Q4E06_12880 [Lautropia sp.]|nr:hypothetical protein [Lautropia sp.]